jgi:hypothetical protein
MELVFEKFDGRRNDVEDVTDKLASGLDTFHPTAPFPAAEWT